MNARLLLVHALSPLHAGTGQGVGAIDLPIAREKATNIPYLPGSSLKGALRDLCDDKTACRAVFGPDTQAASEHAGAAQFADARLVLLPVRSHAGTFAYTTSPYLLARLARDATDTLDAPPASVPALAGIEHCLVPQGSLLTATGSDRVILEDLDLRPAADAAATAWAEWLGARLFPDSSEWRSSLAGRLCVVHDDAMGFLLETATEVVARIKLQDDTKTVQEGGLWYEESLPAESVLASLVLAGPARDGSKLSAESVLDTIGSLTRNTVQLGGKATVGRGLCRLTLAGGTAR